MAGMKMPESNAQEVQSNHKQHLDVEKTIKSKDKVSTMLHYSDVAYDEHYINNNPSVYKIDNVSSKKVTSKRLAVVPPAGNVISTKLFLIS